MGVERGGGGTCILAKFFDIHVNIKDFVLWDIWGYVHSDDFVKNTRKPKKLQGLELDKLRVYWKVS